MKKVLSFLTALTFTFLLQAQAPQLVCYQGVAADDKGAELANADIKVQIKILEASVSGNAIFIEDYDIKTNEAGLFTLDIGSKNPDFNKIKWGTNKYFLQVSMNTGAGLKLIGTSQILSVPYAIYAATAAYADSSRSASFAKTAGSSYDDKDKDPGNEIQSLLVDQSAGTLSIVPAGTAGSSPSVVFNDKDSDPKNELQTLKFDADSGDLNIVDATGKNTGGVNLYDRLLGRPGASASFPQGILGKYKYIKTSDIYVVPQGQTFYVTANGNSDGKVYFEYKGVNMSSFSYPTSQSFPSGTRVNNTNMTGFEVPNDPRIEAVIVDLKNPYQVPPNKVFIILSGLEIGTNTLIVDNELTGFYSVNSGAQYVSIPGGPNGLTIKYPFITASNPILTGYLLDMK